MSKEKLLKNGLTVEQTEKINEKAHKIAQDMGYADSEQLANFLKDAAHSGDEELRQNAERVADKFVTKLQPILYKQKLLNAIGTSSIYSWINKFMGERLQYGNDITFTQTYLTSAGNYKITDFIPTRITEEKIDVFTAQWLNRNGTLTDSSYQYKKSLSLQPATWLPYFQNGKLEEIINNITAEMEETYTMFVAYTIQQAVKQLASGGNQVSVDGSGINGKNCKLKTITSQAPDCFQALLDLVNAIYDLTKDVNTLTIANDSKNLKAVDMKDLVIFVPLPLLAKFERGILSRLPSAEKFKYDEIFKSERIIPIGKELAPVKADGNGAQTDAIIDIKQGQEPFIAGNTKIVVMERRALQHWKVESRIERQFFAENIITQLTNHEWGFTFILPFAKGFVFECANLLTDPAILPNP